ncbi:hypothetical protein NE237_024021 [Protea cynaroides]|uniref:Uncharacterized protein n=1 Tax=Protea cynaroides TaxID=273540 RepID=A0A9Q0K5Y8_9MAGN|nr:hypothetical protein NE237_024021 [Protea cynaroides]
MPSSSASLSTRTTKAMEDVWQDINLVSLNDHPREDLLLSQDDNSRNKTTAYMNELEMENKNLRKEIASLRKEQECQRQHQQSLLARAAQLSKKHTLRRTSTAPF